MTPSDRLYLTLDLFAAVDGDGRPVDAVTSGWFRDRRDLGDEDRGALLETLYSMLRHRGRLIWWLTRHGREETPRNQVLAWLALVDRKTPDDVRRLLSRGGDIALSKPEYNLLVKLQGGSMAHPEMPDTIRLECPDWAEPSLRRRFGDAFDAEMAATLVPPALDLRVNPIKTSREAMIAVLRKLGLPAEETALSPHGIRVPERFSLSRLKPLKTGELEIQDEGSQLVAQLVDAQPGDRVVDFCAGAGGKTLAMAAQMNNRGRIVACDISEGRLRRCGERLRNAGMHNTETRLLTSESDKWVKRHKLSFDRVLIDAPCSGTGTWRRNPDTRWRTPPENGLEALFQLQRRILASAARLVKPGGRLVYATCSMLPEENEAQVAAFVAAFPAFRVVPVAEAMPTLGAIAEGDFLSLTPLRHKTDGFFAAVLQRQEAAAQA